MCMAYASMYRYIGFLSSVYGWKKKITKSSLEVGKKQYSRVLDFYSYLPLHPNFNNIVISNSLYKPTEMSPSFLYCLYICAYVYRKNNTITEKQEQISQTFSFLLTTQGNIHLL